jgi:hypothetical protein
MVAGKSSVRYLVELDQSDFCLFGFLLDSVEGLASHSGAPSGQGLVITVPCSQQKDWESFLASWRASFPERSFALTEYSGP